MSTRSRIGVLYKDGSTDTVYCHFDGYVSGVGAVLNKYHNAEIAAKHIVECGDMGELDKTVVDEGIGKAKHFNTFDSLIDYLKSSDIEYVYLWSELKSTWIVLTDWDKGECRFRVLAAAIIEDEYGEPYYNESKQGE